MTAGFRGPLMEHALEARGPKARICFVRILVQDTTFLARISGRSLGFRANDADNQPAHPQVAEPSEGAEQGSGARGMPAEARRLHPRVYDDPEEAELGAS